MLYDPKWEKPAQTKPAPRSLESLIAWLETQPPETTYDYCKPGTCLVAQWLIASGEPQFKLTSFQVSDLFDGYGDDVVGTFRAEMTFGAALERARALTGAR